ncbi:MAG: hypothetical protein ACRCU2_01315, partial [Planktothrix sp.]
SSPVSFSYVIQHLTIDRSEGIALLKFMSENNIIAQISSHYPNEFLLQKFGIGSENYKFLSSDIRHWSSEVWEEYCNYLMSECGGQILNEYWESLKGPKN